MKSFKSIFQRQLFSPAIGFVPAIIFILLDLFIGVKYAMTIAFTANILLVILALKQFKKQVYNFMIFASILIFGIFMAISHLWFFKDYEFYAPIILEFITIFISVIFLFTKNQILAVLKNTFRAQYFVSIRNNFYEYVWLTTVLLKIFSVQIVFSIVYELSPVINTEFLNAIFYRQTPLYTFILLFLYEQIRLKFIQKNLIQEEWVPVVSESGAVIGRIAKSELKSDHKDLIFPVVKIAFICNNMVYLIRDRKSGQYNWPINRLLPYGVDLKKFINSILSEEKGNSLNNPRLLMKFIENTSKHKQLVFLYTVNIDEKYSPKGKVNGKLWLASQIDDNLGVGLFSNQFEEEYQFIRATVLVDHDELISTHL
ncbi:MAG: hypothetical protein ACRCXN_00200 [Bacteroidales bacterium]